MSKGLEALKKIDHTICINHLARNIVWNIDKEEKCDCESVDQFLDCYDSIEKELQALEIVKNSIVATPDMPKIKTPKGEFIEITLAVPKEKFDLLQEGLKDDTE